MSEQRFEQLQTLTRDAAELLRLPENSERVVLLASLKLAHQVLTERLVAGANVEPNQLLGITETIAKMVPEGPPPAVTVTIVEGIRGIYFCKCCAPPAQIDGEVVKDEPEAQRALPPPPTKAKADPKPIRKCSIELNEESTLGPRREGAPLLGVTISPGARTFRRRSSDIRQEYPDWLPNLS